MPLPRVLDALEKPDASWLSLAWDMFLSSSWTIGRFEFSLSRRRCCRILRYFALWIGRTEPSWSSAPTSFGCAESQLAERDDKLTFLALALRGARLLARRRDPCPLVLGEDIGILRTLTRHDNLVLVRDALDVQTRTLVRRLLVPLLLDRELQRDLWRL